MTRKSILGKAELYDNIFDKVVKLGFSPHIFLTEGCLAEEFGVSRVLIRETLIKLCQDNILRNVPRIGYQIVQLTPADINDSIRTRLILEMGSVKEFFPKASDRQIEILLKKIRTTVQKDDTECDKYSDVWQGNICFHMELAKQSENKLLLVMLKNTLDILWRANIQFFFLDQPEKFLRFNTGSHESIIAAIEARDLDKLQLRLQEDIVSLKKNFNFF